MILALAEWMLPTPSPLAQFTGCGAAQTRRPADARKSAGPFSLEEPAMEENQVTKKPMNKTEILVALSPHFSPMG
jgi:hypothetical protein